jgi:branched-chain amino acid aminotransferase
MAPALNYGQQAYEGLKAFRLPGNDRIAIFRPDRNAARMQHSADFISIPRVPTDLFLDAVRAAVALNAEYVPPHETGAAMYVRPQIYGSSAQLGLNPPEEYTFCVFVIPTGVYHGTHPVKALILDDFDRAAPNGTGSAKVGGNYAPVLRWSEKAHKEGFGITLHLDSKTHEEIDEFSTSGFIGVISEGDNVKLVVPNSKAVIDSVTSDSVQQIARSFGWSVEKRAVSLGWSNVSKIQNADRGRSNTVNSPTSPRSSRLVLPPPWSPSGLSLAVASPRLCFCHSTRASRPLKMEIRRPSLTFPMRLMSRAPFAPVCSLG